MHQLQQLVCLQQFLLLQRTLSTDAESGLNAWHGQHQSNAPWKATPFAHACSAL